MIKRKNKVNFLGLFMTVSILLLGVLSYTKFKENGMKADELKLSINLNQDQVNVNDLVKFNININEPLVGNFILLSTTNEFELNKAEMMTRNSEFIKDIEESERGTKLIFKDEIDYPVTLELQALAILPGETVVNVFNAQENKIDLKFEVSEITSNKETESVLKEQSNNLKLDENQLIVDDIQSKATDAVDDIQSKATDEVDSAVDYIQPKITDEKERIVLPPTMKLRDVKGAIKVPKTGKTQTIEGEYGLVISRFKDSTVSYYQNNNFVKIASNTEMIKKADTGEGTYLYYTSAGIYKGRKLDVKQTILDASEKGSRFGTASPVANSEENMLSAKVFSKTNANERVKLKIEFFDSQTKEQVKVKGVWNMTNVDHAERNNFTTDSVEKVYVREDSELLGIKTNQNGKDTLIVESSQPGGVGLTSPLHMTSIAYGETTKLEVEYYSNHDISWNGYDAMTLVPVAFPDPTKEGKTISQVDRTVEYTTTIYVPFRKLENYEPLLAISDPIIKEISIDNIDVIDEATGKSVSEMFDIGKEQSTATANAKINSLKRVDFYNKVYSLVMKGTVKKDADLSKYKYENGHRLLPNTSQLVVTNVDGSPRLIDSNIAYAPIEEEGFNVEETVQHIDGSVAEKASPEDKLIYRATVLSSYKNESNEVNYESISFTTKIDDSLVEIENIILKDELGAVVGNGNYDSNSRTISAETNTAINRTKNVYLEYNAKVKKVSSGTLITAKTDVEGKYENISTIYSGSSNEVKTVVESSGILIEEVTHTDGSNAEYAEPEDTLHYKMTYESPYFDEVGGKDTYKSIYFESDIKEINENTKSFRNLKARTEKGINLSESYTNGNKLIAQDNTNKIASNEKIIIEFDVTVDSDKVMEDSVISNQSFINLEFSNKLIFDNVQSNRVKTKITGLGSKLTLDFAPELDFGLAKITSENKKYYAKVQSIEENIVKKEVPNYVQVTDKRKNGTGWSLSVKQNGQFQSEKNKKVLTGAEILFKNGQLDSQSTTAKPSLIEKSFSLTPDGSGVSKKIIEAKVGEGLGEWVYNSGNTGNMRESIELSVPGSSVKYLDTYKTTLTWMLTDTPGQ